MPVSIANRHRLKSSFSGACRRTATSAVAEPARRAATTITGEKKTVPMMSGASVSENVCAWRRTWTCTTQISVAANSAARTSGWNGWPCERRVLCGERREQRRRPTSAMHALRPTIAEVRRRAVPLMAQGVEGWPDHEPPDHEVPDHDPPDQEPPDHEPPDHEVPDQDPPDHD